MKLGCTVLLTSLLTSLLLVGCDQVPPIPPPHMDTTCTGLYGSPNESTGLSQEQCFPRIEGLETWTPRVWDKAGFDELLAWSLKNAPAVQADNPYETTPDLQPDPHAVCAIMVTGPHAYRLETFSKGSATSSIDAANAAGGIVTHGGACGTCSALADLEVYARIPDQTNPVRQCAFDHLGDPVEDTDLCIQQEVGFTPPCSRTWAYNAINDGKHCRTPCIISMLGAEPYNLEDGSLNDCLQCDEDVSGAVFKASAGRTRRNSGLASAICRPCKTVWRIQHLYE